VQPGWHRAASGEHRVLWWDPAALDLEVAENLGLKQVNVLKAEGASERSIRDYEKWREGRAAVIATGAAASVSVVRVTDVAQEAPAGTVAVVRGSRGDGRSRGRRFGTLVHSVLRDAAWGATRVELEKLAALHRVITAATEEEQRDAVDAAARALEQPLLRRAALAARCHRELPITFPLTGGRVLEGVIDLAFVEDGQWQVVDFKTDSDVEVNRNYYEQQLRWYLHALSLLTGMPALGTLLEV
jgi:ATP-dependent exoDNAse (exonuclease V) beta subunit